MTNIIAAALLYASPFQPTTNLVSRVETNGVVVLTFERWEPCFAAVYPGCGGHKFTWTEMFTNSPAKL